ncbi:MAG: redox-sensing transcriptional repressor Rex [Maledivibacter sp.]|jgi:redox-sensing transcriptional repressor|nr:redox-sensing transcriptional repressor Rex [Maledivibacter sp.]
MNEKSKISMAVIRRLPKYHRYLKDLLEKDIKRISSKELSDIIGFTASQIRQDLNNFGGYGQQGYGYNVEELYYEIGKILGLDKAYKTIIIGAGNLGQALANYTNFDKVGFEVKALFDINPKLFGIKIRDIEIKDMDDVGQFIKDNDIDIAIVCTNKDSAQEVAEKLVSGGIKAIWNFAPTDLRVSDNVTVENVHLVESLLTLTYLYKSTQE